MKNKEHGIDAAQNINTDKIDDIMTSENQTGEAIEMLRREQIRHKEISKRFKNETGITYETYLFLKDMAERINRDVNLEFSENDEIEEIKE